MLALRIESAGHHLRAHQRFEAGEEFLDVEVRVPAVHVVHDLAGVLDELREPLPVEASRGLPRSRRRFVLDEAQQMQRVVQPWPALVQQIQHEQIGQAPREVVDVRQAASATCLDLHVQLADGVHRLHEARERFGHRGGDGHIARRRGQCSHRVREVVRSRGNIVECRTHRGGRHFVAELAEERDRLRRRLERAQRGHGEADLRQQVLKRVRHVRPGPINSEFRKFSIALVTSRTIAFQLVP